jgi:hypothetical protein
MCCENVFVIVMRVHAAVCPYVSSVCPYVSSVCPYVSSVFPYVSSVCPYVPSVCPYVSTHMRCVTGEQDFRRICLSLGSFYMDYSKTCKVNVISL